MRNAAGRLFLREVFGMRDPQKELLEAQFFDRSNAVAAPLAPTTVEEMTMEEHGFYYVGVIDVGYVLARTFPTSYKTFMYVVGCNTRALGRGLPIVDQWQ